jgi:hypothetical protein
MSSTPVASRLIITVVLHYRYGEGRNHLTFGTRWRLP